MSKHIFIDPELQSRFERDGFVKLSLLKPEDILQLKKLYAAFHPDTPQGFSSSTYSGNYAFKKEVSAKTTAIIGKRLEEVLQNHRPIGAAFLAKAKGDHGEMPMHQDWTIVDEEKYVAVNVWTPLVDCTEENGTLEVLKGSHRFLYVKRMPTLGFVLDGKQYDLLPYLTPIPTKAGEAVILNQALVHYSKPNQVDEVRTAITTGVVSKEAPLMLYHYDKAHPDRIEKFKQDNDFLLKFDSFFTDIYEKPKFGSSEGFVPFTKTSYTWEEVLENIKEAHGGKLPAQAALSGPSRTVQSENGRSFWQRFFGKK